MAIAGSELGPLVAAIIAGEAAAVSSLLAASPALASARVAVGATRQDAVTYFLEDIGHYLYAGDTALHVAAASYRADLIGQLLGAGAGVSAQNRRGATPLHYAADGRPDSARWDPAAQVATIAALLRAGADPNAVDRSGVAPLHRAVRNRCAAAVSALIEGGADPFRTNSRGSSPLLLATRPTGRGGSGSAEAIAQQQQIVRVLQEHAADR